MSSRATRPARCSSESFGAERRDRPTRVHRIRTGVPNGSMGTGEQLGRPRAGVLFETADRVGVITLNRAEARNAVDAPMARAIEAAVDRLEEDSDIRVG